MAEELDDGEFWLPSQFLTDDDILNDFTKSDGSVFGSGSGSGSSFDLGSIGTESSDEDDHLLLSGLPRQFSQSSLDCPVHSKGWVLSSSPQSTLCGCDCNHQGSSLSSGSPNGLVSPPKELQSEESGKVNDDDDDKKSKEKNNENATLDLLNKAAGEVAKMKMRSETGRSKVGTGFFDCSNAAKGLLCPPPPPPPPGPPLQQQPQPPHTNPTHFSPFYSHPHFHYFSPLMWGPAPLPPPQQHNRVTKNINSNTNLNTNNTKTNSSSNNGNARPLGLPPSAWPPLPGQPQAQPQAQNHPSPPQPQPHTQPMMGMFVVQPGQKGTGVFLPRRVSTTAEPKKKSDGNAMKSKNSKGSQRKNSRTPKAIEEEIQLPSEWAY